MCVCISMFVVKDQTNVIKCVSLFTLQCKNSLVAYTSNPRTAWVQEWPGQMVLAGSSTYWTQGVEHGLNTHTLSHFLNNVQVFVLYTNIILLCFEVNVHKKKYKQTYIHIYIYRSTHAFTFLMYYSIESIALKL